MQSMTYLASLAAEFAPQTCRVYRLVRFRPRREYCAGKQSGVNEFVRNTHYKKIVIPRLQKLFPNLLRYNYLL